MCVALYVPSNATITEETLRKCYDRNKDSIGYMFHNEGNLVIRKFLNWQAFITQYNEDKSAYPNTDFAIHFRIMTSGKVDLANCHPFQVTPTIGLIHNGILSRWRGNVKESDTNQFSQEIGTVLSIAKNWDRPFFWEMVDDMIGHSNKMIFMRNDGDVQILKEKQGTWKDNVWFSNMFWDYVVPKYVEHKQEDKRGKYNAKHWKNELNTSNGTFCDECRYLKPNITIMHWGGFNICKECYEKVTKSSTAETTITVPSYITLNPNDIENFKSSISETTGMMILTYAGEKYIVLKDESAANADLTHVEVWLANNKKEYKDYTNNNTLPFIQP